MVPTMSAGGRGGRGPGGGAGRPRRPSPLPPRPHRPPPPPPPRTAPPPRAPPADIVGTMIFDQKTGEFRPKRGPLFANIVLADEINRAPAKVQAGLREAMQERQGTT